MRFVGRLDTHVDAFRRRFLLQPRRNRFHDRLRDPFALQGTDLDQKEDACDDEESGATRARSCKLQAHDEETKRRTSNASRRIRRYRYKCGREISMGAVSNQREKEKKLRRCIGPVNRRRVKEAHELSLVFVKHRRCASDNTWSFYLRKTIVWNPGQRRDEW